MRLMRLLMSCPLHPALVERFSAPDLPPERKISRKLRSKHLFLGPLPRVYLHIHMQQDYQHSGHQLRH
jgi:hypothetical protein